MKLNGIAGKGVGKAGEMVFSVFRGEQVVRWMPQSVKNPNTVRQQLSRAKFRLAVEWSRILNEALAVGFSGVKTQTLSARNEFVKLIIPVSANVITGDTPGSVTMDVTALKMSRGNLPVPPLGQARSEEALTVEIRHEAMPNIPSQYGPGQYGVVVVVIAENIGQSIAVQVLPSSSGAIKVPVPADWSGLDVHVFGFGKVIPEAKNGIPSASEPWMFPSEASATMYLGTVSII